MPKAMSLIKGALIASLSVLAAVVVLNLIFGSWMSAGAMLPAIFGGMFAYWFIWLSNWGAAPKCPTCNTQQPNFRTPTSFRQMLWGGWTCGTCGTEIDRHGRAIDVNGGKAV